MNLRMTIGLGVALAALLLVPLLGYAADGAKAGSLTIEHPWSRPTDALAQTGAVYLVVKNASGTDDRLVAASTPAAGEAGLHMNMNEGGMMRMMPMDAIDVPAHGAATLKPGGYHIMLTSLKAPLKAGSTYPLTLTFEKAGAVTVQVRVEGMGDSGGRDRGKARGGDREMERGKDRAGDREMERGKDKDHEMDSDEDQGKERGKGKGREPAKQARGEAPMHDSMDGLKDGKKE